MGAMRKKSSDGQCRNGLAKEAIFPSVLRSSARLPISARQLGLSLSVVPSGALMLENYMKLKHICIGSVPIMHVKYVLNVCACVNSTYCTCI